MRIERTPAIIRGALGLAILCATVAAAEDKYSVKVPDGLAMSEFEGYEAWQAVSVSHPAGAGEGMSANEALNVILANSIMIEAYAAGIPGNGKPFPDGAKVVKIQYVPKKSTEAPFDVSIPDRLRNVAFMVKDRKRFPASGGWGFANFLSVSGADRFKPDGTGSACGFQCHTAVKGKDFVFTAYGKR